MVIFFFFGHLVLAVALKKGGMDWYNEIKKIMSENILVLRKILL